MSGIHGVFQHRTGYYYTVLEEDFCEVFKKEGKSEVCRAFIASIFEQLTNKQFNENNKDADIWVFMSIPEMARRMRNAYKERSIHKELQGMIEDGYLEKRRSHRGGATMEYKLNLKKIREELASLPEKNISDIAKLQDHRDIAKLQDDVANLQDQSSKIARSSCKNDAIDLANLQARIREDIPEIRKENKKEEPTAPIIPPRMGLPDAKATTPTIFKLSSDWIVTKSEQLRNKPYTENQRAKELASAKKVLARKPDLTENEFIQVFTKRNDEWWQEHVGLLNVTHLAATPKDQNDIRFMLVLEQINRQPTLFSGANNGAATAKPERSHNLVPELQAAKNRLRMFRIAAAKKREKGDITGAEHSEQCAAEELAEIERLSQQEQQIA